MFTLPDINWYLAISMEMADWYTKHVQDHYAGDRAQLERVMCDNALELFPRLRNSRSTSVKELEEV
jgi:hypothetical protein